MPNSYMTPKDPFTPGSIETTGTYLYQLAIPDDKNKEPCNLWSGRIDSNNGFPVIHAKQAAALFTAAPDLLKQLEIAHRFLRKNGYDMTDIDAAIAKAKTIT